VHGVESTTSGQQSAGNALKDLQTAVNTALAPQITAYQTAHPGTTIVLKSALANLYTATPSPYHPSNSSGPLGMDGWSVGSPGCTTTAQGQPCTTAYEWRYRLAGQIVANFGASAKNVILIGHSTGARTAMEVAANTGPSGLGTENWNVQSMIAGVATVHGMLDGLNSSAYNFIGWSSFDTGCKDGGVLIDDITGSATPGPGWCEYAGDVSGFPSADWVAENKSTMMLTAWASCSPSLWTGYNDGDLPWAAQGSPHAVGTSMAPAAGTTYLPAHGQFYGAFCHSDITDASHANHTAAVNAATSQIVTWLFTSARKVVASGSLKTPVISYGNKTPVYPTGGSCPAGTVNDTFVTVVGDCSHPGLFDGNDHPVSQYPTELTIPPASNCSSTFQWEQHHDSNNGHAATFWWKTYSHPPSGGLIGTLSAN